MFLRIRRSYRQRMYGAGTHDRFHNVRQVYFGRVPRTSKKASGGRRRPEKMAEDEPEDSSVRYRRRPNASIRHEQSIPYTIQESRNVVPPVLVTANAILRLLHHHRAGSLPSANGLSASWTMSSRFAASNDWNLTRATSDSRLIDGIARRGLRITRHAA